MILTHALTHAHTTHAHILSDGETINFTSFSSCDKRFPLIRGIYDLEGLPNFYTKQMSLFVNPRIEQSLALIYIDDILLPSNSKEHVSTYGTTPYNRHKT